MAFIMLSNVFQKAVYLYSAWYFVKGNPLIHANIRRQAQHPLRNNIAQDLIGTAFQTVTNGAEEIMTTPTHGIAFSQCTGQVGYPTMHDS